MRIPAVHSTHRIAPTGSGRSVITNDSLHDIGGNFPNWLIYPAVCDQLIADLHTLQALTAP